MIENIETCIEIILKFIFKIIIIKYYLVITNNNYLQ